MIFKHCDPRPSRAEIDDAEKSRKISAFWGHLSVLLRSNFERKSKIGLKPKKSSVVLLSFDESFVALDVVSKLGPGMQLHFWDYFKSDLLNSFMSTFSMKGLVAGNWNEKKKRQLEKFRQFLGFLKMSPQPCTSFLRDFWETLVLKAAATVTTANFSLPPAYDELL